MKRFFVCFAILTALIFVISCGSGGSKTGDNTDTGEGLNDEDTADTDLVSDTEPGGGDTEPSDNPDTVPDNPDSDDPDTVPDNPDSDDPDTTPDAGDSAPDNGDSTPDNGDSQPDDGDTKPDNDYPQTPCDPNPCLSDANSTGVCTIKNDSYVCGCKYGYIFDGTLCIKSLPECSPSSDTPCIDSATGLIWSAKSENKMPWNDALNYCQNLTEGDFNDWRLPSIAVLKTLVQNCSSAKCTEDYTGKYSKFGDTVYLWSSSESEDSTAQSIYFSDASTQAVSTDTNVNVRCVRRESESRESNCTGLIENSVWNTATQITQTWDWETADWTPSPEGSYNTDASSSECRFKCDSSSFREGSKCLNPCKPNPCYSNGTTGTCIGKNANEYRCECEENYFWDGSSCLNPCKPNPCTGIGDTGTCIGKSANEYSCECEESYVWNPSSNKCMKTPCDPNPCNIPNSTGICNQVTEIQYACECSSGYYWHGKTEGCKTEPLTLGNICTGQNKCYSNSGTMTCPAEGEDFFGQDAWYASLGKCVPQSFTVQTISDQNVVLDNNTGLMWQQTIPTDKYKRAAAVSYCNDLSYAGYSDWRLPTPLELLTIVDNSKCDPAIDTTYFPDTPSSIFWSSSTDVTTPNYAWFVKFIIGGVSSTDMETINYVRCVRGTTLPTSSFNSTTVNGDVIVTDTKTGLVWQKTYETEKNWQQALDYCEDLTYAGYSDWRLPDKNELASLVNYKKYNPASNFPDISGDLSWWSSSTGVYNTLGAWCVHFNAGYVDVRNKTYNGYVRCVR